MGSMKNRAIEAEAELDAVVECVGCSCGDGVRQCQIETRIVPASFEVETRADKTPRLRGYAAVFNKTVEIFPGYNERVAPGAFTRTLEEGADVRALFNHNPDLILGRSTADPPTLEMSEDKKGLKVSIDPPDTQVGRDLVTSIERGDISQMSFAFKVVAYDWSDAGDVVLRTLTDVDLFDVSAVTYPAYPQTDIAVRSLREWRVKNPSKIDHTEQPEPATAPTKNEIDYSEAESIIDAVRTRPGCEVDPVEIT